MNQVTRMNSPPVPPPSWGNWVWDGSNWVCDPDCPPGMLPPPPPPPPCPPMGPPVFSGPAGQPPWYPGANGGVSFGSVAPPNPVRGHMWWDGTVLWLFDGAAWVTVGGTPSAVGGGAAVGTSPPSAPFTGQLWFNGSVLFIWNGTAWVPSSANKTWMQATAPPSPAVGDEWWDSKVLRIWDGTIWQAIGPGMTTGPVQTTTKVFQVGTNTTAAFAVNTWVIAPIDGTPTINTNGVWSPTAFTFTPNKAGAYNFEIQHYMTSTSFDIALLLNDSGPPMTNIQGSQVICQAPSNVAGWGQAGGMAVMNGTTDFVRLWVYAFNNPSWGASLGFPDIRAFLLP